MFKVSSRSLHPHPLGTQWELVCGRGYRPYKELELEDIPAAVQAGGRPMFPPAAHVPAAYRQLAAACW